MYRKRIKRPTIIPISSFINAKIKQRARYTKAALFGADLYDRVAAKKQNRMEKMGRSPIHKQTFAISPRGTVRPVHFFPGTNQFVDLEED